MFIYTPTCIHVYIYTYLLLKIYNQIEDAVHRMCLLVPQDINSVQKIVYLPFTVTMGLHLINNPGLPECTINTL